MKKILSNLSKADEFPNGIKWILNVFETEEYPIDKAQLDEWARNFHLHLSDFRKLLCNFETRNVTSLLKKVYEQHCTNDMIAVYEMFG